MVVAEALDILLAGPLRDEGTRLVGDIFFLLQPHHSALDDFHIVADERYDTIHPVFVHVLPLLLQFLAVVAQLLVHILDRFFRGHHIAVAHIDSSIAAPLWHRLCHVVHHAPVDRVGLPVVLLSVQLMLQVFQKLVVLV